MTDLLDLKKRYQSSPQILTDHELCELAMKAPSKKLSVQNIFSSPVATLATGHSKPPSPPWPRRIGLLIRPMSRLDLLSNRR